MKTNIKKNGLHFSPLTLSSYENNYIASKNRSLSTMHTLIFLFVQYLLCCVSGSLLNSVVAWVRILTWMQGSNWQFADRHCPFADHFKQFFAKLTNQYFPSVRICLQGNHEVSVYTSSSTIRLYLTPNKLFSSIQIAFWPQTPMGKLTGLHHTPQLLKLLTKFSRITSEKIILTLEWRGWREFIKFWHRSKSWLG